MTRTQDSMTSETEEPALPNNTDTQGSPPDLSKLLAEAQEVGASLVDAGRTLATQAARDIDQKGLAGGVIAMSAGEMVGSAIGGVLGAVAGPGGAVVGAQLGGFAGSSLGARYGYDCAAALGENKSEDGVVAPTEILSKRGSERLGEAVGEAGGAALGALVGGPETQAVLGVIGERMGGSLGEHAQNQSSAESPDPTNRQRSYRKAPTQAWFKRIIKEHLADTALSGALGFAGGLVAGAFGRTLGQRAGLVASSRLQWSEPNTPEFVDPRAPLTAQPTLEAGETNTRPEEDKPAMADKPH